MRTLKKTLSLVLVLAMVLSLGVSAFAATEYPDLDQSNHQEAVAVVSAIGVIGGNADGTLNATGTLTRAEGARIIYSLMGRNAATAGSSSTSFTDVPSSHWASAYIAYANAQGILHGVGNKKFDPEGTLTGYAFAKMLLGALGYDYEKEGITAETWELDTYKLMSRAGLDTDLVNNDYGVAVTRDEAFQMTFNSLTATMVEYKGGVTVGGVVINADRSDVEGTKTANKDYRDSDPDTDATRQLCERYFPDLKLNDSTAIDDLGRGANGWSYKSEEVIKAANNSASLSFVVTKALGTADVEHAVQDQKSSYVFNNVGGTGGATAIYLNGVSGKLKTEAVKVGDEIEVYIESGTTNRVEKVVIIRYDTMTVNTEPTVKTTSGSTTVNVSDLSTGTISADRITGYSGLAKDDVVYYYTGTTDGATTATTGASGNVTYHIAKAETVTGQLTKKTGSSVAAKYTVSGTDYQLNENISTLPAQITSDVYNTDYAYYLDPNGFIISLKKVEDSTTSGYVVLDEITYVEGTGKLGESHYVEARIVKMDGTTETVTVGSIDNLTNKYVGIDTTSDIAPSGGDKTDDSNGSNKYLVCDQNKDDTTKRFDLNVTGVTQNMFFTYEVNDDNEYELTKVAVGGNTGLDSGTNANLPANTVITNGASTTSTGTPAISISDDTVFVVAAKSGSDNTKHEYSVYTGKDEVPTIDISSSNGSTAYVTENNIATYVFIGTYGTKGDTKDTVFILGARESTEYDTSGSTRTELSIYQTIEKGELNEETKFTSAGHTAFATTNSGAVGLYEATYNDKGYINALNPATAASGSTPNDYDYQANGYTYTKGTIRVNGIGYTIADSAVVYTVETDDGVSVTDSTAASLKASGTDATYVIFKTESGKKVVDYVVIYKAAEDGGAQDGVTLSSLTIAGQSGAVVSNSGTISITGTSGSITVEKGGAFKLTPTTSEADADITIKVDGTKIVGDATDSVTNDKITANGSGSATNQFTVADSGTITIEVGANGSGTADNTYTITVTAVSMKLDDAIEVDQSGAKTVSGNAVTITKDTQATITGKSNYTISTDDSTNGNLTLDKDTSNTIKVTVASASNSAETLNIKVVHTSGLEKTVALSITGT